MNASFHTRGWPPVYTASPRSRIVLVGQAPGRIAQETRTPWNDASGRTLRQWLGVTDEQFYDPDLFALMPMDFYYPGKAAIGVCQKVASTAASTDAGCEADDFSWCSCSAILS